MAEGYHDFVAGEDLTAANLEDYCEAQSIMRFASASARDTALSAIKAEGMFAYLKDVNTITVYSGAAWSTLGPVHGALTAAAITVTQSGAVAATVFGGHQRMGRMIYGSYVLGITGSGTGANDIVVNFNSSLPTAASTDFFVGTGVVLDTSASARWMGPIYLASTTTFKIQSSTVATLSYQGSSGMVNALASGDAIYLDFKYQAASDA